jgi:hypothetical protein
LRGGIEMPSIMPWYVPHAPASLLDIESCFPTASSRRTEGERLLSAALSRVRFWPNAPVDERRLNDRSRDIAAVGSVKLNGNKVSI